MIGSKAVRIVDAMDLPDGADDVRARTFETLLDRRTLDRAYRIARVILGDPIEAEDATHDAALAAWRRFAELREVVVLRHRADVDASGDGTTQR